MKKYELSSSLTGLCMELVYDNNEHLIGCTVSDAKDLDYLEVVNKAMRWSILNLSQLTYLHNWVEQKKKDWVLTEIKEVVSFEDFWEAYGVKKDKKVSQDVWKRLKALEQQKAINAISRYNNELKLSNEFKKHPKTYLRQKKWEDYE